jgi:nicotinamidase-related amidase
MHQPPTLCDATRSLLLVVDIQPALTTAMPEQEAELMLNNTASLLQAAGTLGIPVLLTEQYPKGLGTTEPSLLEQLPAAARKFEKTGFSCCAAEGFAKALADTGRDQIIMVGQETHVCVLQTAFDLLNRGLPLFVAEDATCSRQSTHKLFALERMRTAGATITNYESVLFEWLRDAAHPDFKTLSKLLR